VAAGYGLAFVQLMVERMGGTVEVESELGKGATFTVTLPVKNATLPFVVPLEPPAPLQPGRSVTRRTADSLVIGESIATGDDWGDVDAGEEVDGSTAVRP